MYNKLKVELNYNQSSMCVHLPDKEIMLCWSSGLFVKALDLTVKETIFFFLFTVHRQTEIWDLWIVLWVQDTVPLKSKLTVTRILRIETRDKERGEWKVT